MACVYAIKIINIKYELYCVHLYALSYSFYYSLSNRALGSQSFQGRWVLLAQLLTVFHADHAISWSVSIPSGRRLRVVSLFSRRRGNFPLGRYGFFVIFCKRAKPVLVSCFLAVFYCI